MPAAENKCIHVCIVKTTSRLETMSELLLYASCLQPAVIWLPFAFLWSPSSLPAQISLNSVHFLLVTLLRVLSFISQKSAVPPSPTSTLIALTHAYTNTCMLQSLANEAFDVFGFPMKNPNQLYINLSLLIIIILPSTTKNTPPLLNVGVIGLFLCRCVILPALCAIKWSRLTPLKIRLRNTHHSAARHVVCRLTEQMLASLYIFISIHVSISKGMEVNPLPQGKGMTQCFVFAFFFPQLL